MPVRYLDCASEVSPVKATPRLATRWLAAEISESDWLVPLAPNALSEVHELAAYIENNPVDLMQRRIDDFALMHCRIAMGKMVDAITKGVGFAVLDRLPVNDYPIETLIEVYWLLGQLVGRPVAQKYNGQMIYHVHDTGQQFQYGVRGSHTNIELNFHTDNAFGQMVPDSVGLLCQTPAKSGGISRFCSLYSVHHRIAQIAPDALQRLYEPMYFDRQREHAADDAPVTWAPFFSWREERLFARANPSLVRKGYEVAQQQPDDRLLNALEIVDAVSSEPDLWFESPLESGQIQYLNNHEVGHYRSKFIDHDAVDKRRSLFRLWHRAEGAICYHGLTL